jgi:hypothetical protein
VIVAMTVLGWIFFMIVFLYFWSGVHALARAAEGIDEDEYVDGLDERSLAEAA